MPAPEPASEVLQLRVELMDGLRAAGEEATDNQVDALLQYLSLLKKWSRAYNLTAIREPRAMLVQHIFDSVSVLPFVRGERLLDIGSGAGLPGFVVAILRPCLHVTMLDSVGKKARFCKHAAATLNLKNVSVVNGRIEEHNPVTPYQTATCRAFASLEDFYTASVRLIDAGGRMVAMKGKSDGAEVAAAERLGAEVEIVPVSPVGVVGARHIISLAPRQIVEATIR